MSYKTKEDILSRGRDIIGIPLGQIDQTDRLKTGKGAIGSVIEESWFGYNINSNAEPDFKEAGVELKVTPFIRTKKGVRAKERLVCNIINFMEEYKLTFLTSSFYTKCNTMLLMSYEYFKDIPKSDFEIVEATLFSFPEEDLFIIEKDWETIVKKIKSGKAHEISEGDTLYLGACTKGASSQSVRKQPFSEILAKQRAFSLKQSYMTYILNNYILGTKEDENIIKDPLILKNHSFENVIIDKITPYLGQSQQKLLSLFEIETNAKNVNEILLSRILGIKGKISSTEEFKKANIIPKTIRVNQNGSIAESMSFPIFDFQKINSETWDDSEFKSMLEQTKFLFVIFKYNEKGKLIFENIQFWNIPERDLGEVEKVWNNTVETIRNGVVLKKIGKKTYNNLPKSKENRVAHVRPHGKNAQDTLLLPDGREMTKQCFWLNNTYIEEQISKK